MGKLSKVKKMVGNMGKRLFNWKEVKYPINIFSPINPERKLEITSIQPVIVIAPTRINMPIRKKVVSQSKDLIPSKTEP